MTCDYHAQVVEPDAGKIVEGRVLLWRHEHEGCRYAIVENVGTYLAICTEVRCCSSAQEHYQLRSVALEEPKGQRAWDVLRRNGGGIWEPVEGQHLHARTALAEQWLLDIGPALTSLSMKRKQLLADQRALSAEQSNRIGAMPAQAGIRGGCSPSSGDLHNENAAMHDPTITAEHRADVGSESITEKRVAAGDKARWSVIRLGAGWLQAIGRCCHLGHDQPHDKVNRQDSSRSPDLIQSSDTHSSPVTHSPEHLELVILKDVATRLAKADELVRFLQRNLGSQVTLLQTAIEGRSVEVLPTLPRDLRLAPRISPGYRMRL